MSENKTTTTATAINNTERPSTSITLEEPIVRGATTIEALQLLRPRTADLRGLMLAALGSSIFDRKGIDGVLDGSAHGVLCLGRIGAKVQNGELQRYIGLAVILAMIAFGLYWYLG